MKYTNCWALFNEFDNAYYLLPLFSNNDKFYVPLYIGSDLIEINSDICNHHYGDFKKYITESILDTIIVKLREWEKADTENRYFYYYAEIE